MKFQGIWKLTTKISVKGLILSTKCSMDFIFGYWAYPSFSPIQLIIKSSPVQKAAPPHPNPHTKKSKYSSKNMSKNLNHKDNINTPQITDEKFSIFR